MSDRKPSQSKVLDRFERRLRLELRTVIPAEVVTYDSTKRRARVQACTSAILADGRAVDLPPIPAAPVIFPRGGGFSIEWPIAKGDTGALLISDRALDRFLQTGQCAPPRDGRTHALSDAVYLPGLTPDPSVGPAVEASSLVLRNLNTGAKVTIRPGPLGLGEIEAEAPSIKLGAGATLPIARVSDTVGPDVTFALWISQMTAAVATMAAAFNVAGPLIGAPGTVPTIPTPPVDMGLITSGASKATAE